MNNRGFVFTGIAFLMIIPAIILAASFVNVRRTGDDTITIKLYSDKVFYTYANIESNLNITGASLVSTHCNDTDSILNYLNSTWRSFILQNYAGVSGITITLPEDQINVSYDSINEVIRIGNTNTSKGIPINITFPDADIRVDKMLSPLAISASQSWLQFCLYGDITPPVITISSPANRTYCTDSFILSYSVSESTDTEEYSIDGGSNISTSNGSTIDISALANQPHSLTIYANDSNGNIGNTIEYFYIKDYVYVTSHANTTGNVTDFDYAKSTSDSDNSANITENSTVGTVSTTGTESHPVNQEFTSDASGWSSSATGGPGSFKKGIWEDIGNPAGSINADLFTKNKDNEAVTWQASFTYNNVTPDSAILNYDYSVTDWDFADTDNNNRFRFMLEKPDASTVTLDGWNDLSGTTGWTSSGSISLTTSDFSSTGTYTFYIDSELSTLNTNGAQVKINFDNVEINITSTSSVPSGTETYSYDINFTTTDSPIVDAPNHELQVRYRMPSPNEENTSLYILDGSTWNLIQTLEGNSSFNTLSYFMTQSEYNSGTVKTRYWDVDRADDTDQSTIFIDYHRIC